VTDRTWLLSGLLLGVGVGIVGLASLTVGPRLEPGDRVLLIGDSLAVGLKPHLAKLSQEYGTHLLAKPSSGTNMVQWLSGPDGAWLKQALATFKPTHVLVSLGTNDAYANFTPEQIQANIRKLVHQIRDAGAKVVWLGPPTLPERYNGRAPNVATLQIIDREAPMIFQVRNYEVPRSDGLHPTVRGYAGWAGLIWQFLLR
jgi:lysophospholipase L1-like esterase